MITLNKTEFLNLIRNNNISYKERVYDNEQWFHTDSIVVQIDNKFYWFEYIEYDYLFTESKTQLNIPENTISGDTFVGYEVVYKTVMGQDLWVEV